MTGKQKKALAALLSAATMQQAARTAGVSYSSLRRWLAEDTEFRRQYNRELQSIVERAAVQARAGMAEAVSALREIVTDGEAAQNARVSAARAILESGAKLVEIADFEARLAALEKNMEEDV